MPNPEPLQLLYLLGLLVLVGSGFLRFRESPRTVLRYGLAWAGIIALLALGWVLFG